MKLFKKFVAPKPYENTAILIFENIFTNEKNEVVKYVDCIRMDARFCDHADEGREIYIRYGYDKNGKRRPVLAYNIDEVK